MTAIQDTADAPVSTVRVRPVAGHIGADISGADISRPLTAEQADAIRDALHRYKVIFFRGQDLDHAAQIAFGRQFGELTYAHPHDDAPPEQHPEIFTVDPRRYEKRYGDGFREENRRRQYSYFTGWHTDVTAAVNPPAGSILRAEVVPEVGATPSGPTWSRRTRGCPSRFGRSWRRCGPSTVTAARTRPAPTAPTRNGSTTICWWRSTRWSGSTR
jgi:taurine dioxygenase